ncbi:hypothetical protein ACFO9Q_08210 [Paenibacillus sp. GCM10023252]|uniref:hypothetical protein n=1 Tax=Paenibacillus sp. GCM10023252 TaxID=3252649 RepID=UPI00360F29BE
MKTIGEDWEIMNQSAEMADASGQPFYMNVISSEHAEVAEVRVQGQSCAIIRTGGVNLWVCYTPTPAVQGDIELFDELGDRIER